MSSVCSETRFLLSCRRMGLGEVGEADLVCDDVALRRLTARCDVGESVTLGGSSGSKKASSLLWVSD